MNISPGMFWGEPGPFAIWQLFVGPQFTAQGHNRGSHRTQRNAASQDTFLAGAELSKPGSAPGLSLCAPRNPSGLVVWSHSPGWLCARREAVCISVRYQVRVVHSHGTRTQLEAHRRHAHRRRMSPRRKPCWYSSVCCSLGLHKWSARCCHWCGWRGPLQRGILGLRLLKHRLRLWKQHLRLRDRRHRLWDRRHRLWDRRHRLWDQRHRLWDRRHRLCLGCRRCRRHNSHKNTKDRATCCQRQKRAAILRHVAVKHCLQSLEVTVGCACLSGHVTKTQEVREVVVGPHVRIQQAPFSFRWGRHFVLQHCDTNERTTG